MKSVTWKISASMLAASFLLAAGCPALEIAIIGDSTVCDYESPCPRRGWGQLLPEFLVPDVRVLNEAERGKSAQSFPVERWQRILKARPGFVLIQFGHNDSFKRCPIANYKIALRRYISEAREAGITPILVTPMHRRTFEAGQLTDEMAPYIEAMKEISPELGVPVIDLYQKTGFLFQSLGEEKSSFFTINLLEGGSKEDRTHFTESGARELAGIVAASLKTMDPRLGPAVKQIPSK